MFFRDPKTISGETWQTFKVLMVIFSFILVYCNQISLDFICSMSKTIHWYSLANPRCLCSVFLFFPSTSKLSCGVVDAKSPPARCVPTHSHNAWKGWLDCQEVSGLFISQLKLRLVYCRGDPHWVAQTLPRRLFTITMLTLALSLAVRRTHIYVFSL